MVEFMVGEKDGWLHGWFGGINYWVVGCLSSQVGGWGGKGGDRSAAMVFALLEQKTPR